MTVQKLDALFPYLCFFYGALMTAVLNSAALARIADEKLPAPLVVQWRAHRGLALFSLCLMLSLLLYRSLAARPGSHTVPLPPDDVDNIWK